MKATFLLLGLVFLLIASRYACFFTSKSMDEYRRPWAYSKAENAPLLVGKWAGTCTDPDGVVHALDVDIHEPLSDEERWDRLRFKRRKKKSRSSVLFFDGVATISVEGKTEDCEMWGGFEDKNFETLHFQCRRINDKHRVGFNMNLFNGAWKADEITLSVTWAWFDATGASIYRSDDIRHNTDGHLTLRRVGEVKK